MLRRHNRSEVRWWKCKDCRFFDDVSDHGVIRFMCRITGESLELTNCVKEESE